MSGMVRATNPDGTYIGSGPPSGTQDVSITGQPITVTSNVGTGTRDVAVTGQPIMVIETAPAGLSNAYGFSLHDLPGVVAANNFLSVFNPLASGKNLYLIQSVISRYSIGDATSGNSLIIYRTTAASAGTLQAASTISKGDSTDPSAVAEVRIGNPTTTLGAELVAYGPPTGQDSTPRSDQITANSVVPFIIAPGEGIVYRTLAGDVDQRWNIAQFWLEINV